ncbi:hypothetical protein CDD80_4416 [Ophiocordyceps camponoti-rufipedis]|uniref:Uncharacterized protein n=1 Tax=Ophiocordyceps camponoti-rufipedis TaxID=2004952 RepID=A0A2C5Y3C4_9HYPO|nr:hypothetical protein CDD80_4416 [Ophiocordyceps camponoti-rufipedis]
MLCGTRRYCEAFDGAKNRTDFAYDSARECFDDHEPEPAGGVVAAVSQPGPLLDWVQAVPEHADDCAFGIRFITEAMCGTRRYCETLATLGMARAEQRFVSKAECLAAHAPDPSKTEKQALLPWTQGRDGNRLCGIYGWREDLCGTQRYCDAVDVEPELGDGRFDSADECYAAHEPRPVGWTARNKSLRMAWHFQHSPRIRQWCVEQRFWHIACGTEGYCEGYDIDFNNTDARFESRAACLDAFEDRPMMDRVNEVERH